MTTEEYIRRLVADWPPLSADQRSRLRVLLRAEARPEDQPAETAEAA